MRRTLLLASFFLASAFAQTATAPAPPTVKQTPTLSQKEEFLTVANVLAAKTAAKGVTNTKRATLTNGSMTHDASIQRIDEQLSRFEGSDGNVEVNFRDTYKFNIAAYRLGKMLGLQGMIPPSIERKYEGTDGAFTWWVEDVAMDEAQRQKKKIQPPDKESFNRQYVIMQVFDNLIYNTDRNQTNILFDKEWRLWMIDHTRAFRTRKEVMNPKTLKTCDRVLLAKMKELTFEKMKPELTRYLHDDQIRAILARRDKIVEFYDAKGDSALYTFLPNQ
jgi:hypothetical protein